jgi:hypothetical protein
MTSIGASFHGVDVANGGALILDAIQGHRPRNVAEGYGEVTIRTQVAAIAKLPRYKVSQ